MGIVGRPAGLVGSQMGIGVVRAGPGRFTAGHRVDTGARWVYSEEKNGEVWVYMAQLWKAVSTLGFGGFGRVSAGFGGLRRVRRVSAGFGGFRWVSAGFKWGIMGSQMGIVGLPAGLVGSQMGIGVVRAGPGRFTAGHRGLTPGPGGFTARKNGFTNGEVWVYIAQLWEAVSILAFGGFRRVWAGLGGFRRVTAGFGGFRRV
jgi:hypothetical protein